MDFLELARRRHSIRGYTDKTIEEEKLNYILECARVAPSACNLQPWHLYIVKSEAKRQTLRQCYTREWFAGAPLYIVVCADEANAWIRQEDGKNHADVDASILTEHICLAAEAQGLGSCWVCAFNVAKCREALELASTVHPVAIIPIGYIGNGEQRVTTRKAINEIVTVI